MIQVSLQFSASPDHAKFNSRQKVSRQVFSSDDKKPKHFGEREVRVQEMRQKVRWGQDIEVTHSTLPQRQSNVQVSWMSKDVINVPIHQKTSFVPQTR